MEIINTKDMNDVASFNAIIYGEGGVGKSTMASTFPNPVMLDFENGVKYFKQRGIELPTIQMNHWPTEEEKKKFAEIIKDYDTVIIDPIGRAMQMLIDDKKAIAGSKYRQVSGDLTMAGWGEAKKQMRNFVSYLLGTNKNIILVAHITEDKDESTGSLVKRPLIPTGLKDELITMVDVVAYFGNRSKKDDDGEEEIVRFLDMRTGQNHVSKDRTGTLNDPEFNGFVKPSWEFIEELLKKGVAKTAKKAPAKKTTAKKTTAKKTTKKEEKPEDINPFEKDKK